MANPGAQVSALGAVDDMVAIALRFRQLYFDIKGMQQRQTQNNYTGTLNAMATYAVNADGSAGATDGSPNNAHPIVGIAVSANKVSGFMGYIVGDFISFVEGGAVGTADRRPALEQIIS